jgi:tRNA threonylcarbamoyladenosine biosynthesis protein TsaB
MKLLAVDTALGACSAVILDDEMVRGHAFEPMQRGHAERVAPMVQDVMLSSGLNLDAVDRLAVTVGPGTFTGQRVGYAFMRGLKLALGRPLIGITTLAAMAEAAMAQTGTGAAAVLHDARRDEVYLTLVTKAKTLSGDRLVSIAEAVDTILEFDNDLTEGLAVAGTASRHAAEILLSRGCKPVLSDIVAPDALWVARVAMSATEPETTPRPLYLRPPDARLPASPPR